MKVEQIYTGCLSEATYFIKSNNEAAIIDPLRETDKYLEKIKKGRDGRRNEYLPTKPMLEAWQNYCNALLVNPKFEHALRLAQTVILTRESVKLKSKKNK